MLVPLIIYPLCFECFKEAFSYRIVPAISFTAHTLGNQPIISLDHIGKCCTSVLYSSVWVKDQFLGYLPIVNCHSPCLDNGTLCTQIIAHCPSYHFSVKQVDLTEHLPLRQLSHKYGEKPGPIRNETLSGEITGSIKINLREGHSYVVVPPTLWDLLHSWYGGGPMYRRQIITTTMKKKKKKQSSPTSPTSPTSAIMTSIPSSPSSSSRSMTAATHLYMPPNRTFVDDDGKNV